jgi:hypothetical protein
MSSLSVAQRPSKHAVDHTVIRTASAAHRVVDAFADRALTGVGKVSGSLHVAVNHAADAANSAAGWVAQAPAQMEQKTVTLSKRAIATVKARPFVTVASAIALGFIIGRLARR